MSFSRRQFLDGLIKITLVFAISAIPKMFGMDIHESYSLADESLPSRSLLQRSLFSASRPPDKDWKELQQKLVQKVRSDFTLLQWNDVVANIAAPYEQLDIHQIQEWTRQEIKNAFFFVRDIQFLEDSNQPASFLRRSTWLFPDDGCYARAAMMIKQMTSNGFPAANRIFIFGNLSVKTTNSPTGEVTWWYHTAPIVRTKKIAYVLDPSMEPHAPLTLREWVRRQTRDPNSVNLVICAPHSYHPGSSCKSPPLSDDTSALYDLETFLMPEWQRQLDLGRDPFLVLGNNPPW